VAGHQAVGANPHGARSERLFDHPLERFIASLPNKGIFPTPRLRTWKTMPPEATFAVLGMAKW
jgi:hypothetical protein